MSVPKSKYKVYIYQNDYQNMCKEVYKHQNIETGGNLFGLWTSSGSAVVHVVLGPGQHCQRTNVSFHQDLEYMGRVGRFVNENYMLCHIGEWHSHHNLSLDKPSKGDEDTIRRNYPEGMTKFLVIIANIRNRDTIVLSPYFFTHGGTRYEKAERIILESNGPFSSDKRITDEIEMGAEKKEYGQHETCSTAYRNQENNSLTRFQERESSSRTNASSSDSLVNLTTRRLENKSSLGAPKFNASSSDVNGSLTNPNNPDSQANPYVLSAGDQGEPMDTCDSDPPPKEGSCSKPVATCQPSSPMESQLNSPTEQEIVLRKIHDKLKHCFGSHPESTFKFQKSKNNPGAVEIVFKHNKKYWMVLFPKDFPTKPAGLFCGMFEETLHVSKVYKSDIVEPLNNEVNILLSIKKRCDDNDCNTCKHFKSLSVSQSNNFNLHGTESLMDVVNGLANDITTKLRDVNDLKKNCLSETNAEITFMHDEKCWTVNVDANFPQVPAKLCRSPSTWSSQKLDVTLHGQHSCGPQPLNTSQLILKAIILDCYCSPCFKLHRQYR